MLKTHFIKQGIKEAEIDSFIRKTFPLGDYSHTELQRTPLGIKVIIYTNKPGRIIGKGGKNIDEILEALKKRFSLENPQLDVKGIENPDLDAQIVSKQIASALEKGYNHKKIGNLTLKRIMDSGAAGAEIVIAGKTGGTKGSATKFIAGYLKHCGEQAFRLVDHGFGEALVKGGKIGIKVAIMKNFEDITGQLRDVRSPKSILPPEVEEAPSPDMPAESPKKKARARKEKKEAELETPADV